MHMAKIFHNHLIDAERPKCSSNKSSTPIKDIYLTNRKLMFLKREKIMPQKHFARGILLLQENVLLELQSLSA